MIDVPRPLVSRPSACARYGSHFGPNAQHGLRPLLALPFLASFLLSQPARRPLRPPVPSRLFVGMWTRRTAGGRAGTRAPSPKISAGSSGGASLQELAPARKRTWVAPRHVDTLIAAIGSTLGIALVAASEQVTGVPLVIPPMLSAGIVFFYGSNPPSPKAFLWGTAASSTLGLTITTTCAQCGLPWFVGTSMSVASLLMVYRLWGFTFPSLAAFPGLLAGAAQVPGASSSLAAVRFLCFPWLAGHVVLYSVAMATSVARRIIRNRLTSAMFARWGTLSDESLRETFNRFDTNGNGNLDYIDLQVGLRSIGYTVNAKEAEALIQTVDVDGNGVIDFEEFKAVVRQAI